MEQEELAAFSKITPRMSPGGLPKVKSYAETQARKQTSVSILI